MEKTGNIFFASDFHLGLPTGTDPLEREKKVVSWLKKIAAEAKEIYLLGDVFDFWWEYKLVVPRGFTRFLGTVSEITDSGIPVHFFPGNHDLWAGNYLTDECGMIIHRTPVTITLNGKKFHLAHGEGLGSGSILYRILLSIFRNRPLQILYSALHPSIGVGFGHKWSLHSRLGKGISIEFLGEEKEDLLKYARTVSAKDDIDFFIFGHRHLAMSVKMQNGSEVVILGDWIRHSSFAEWNGRELLLSGYNISRIVPQP